MILVANAGIVGMLVKSRQARDKMLASSSDAYRVRDRKITITLLTASFVHLISGLPFVFKDLYWTYANLPDSKTIVLQKVLSVELSQAIWYVGFAYDSWIYLLSSRSMRCQVAAFLFCRSLDEKSGT